MVLGFTAAALSLVMMATASFAASDIKAGQKTYVLCAACHSREKAKNMAGPSLFGIVGRKAAATPGYLYSPALQRAGEDGVVWDEATLDRWLIDSKTVHHVVHVMRLPDGKQRQDLIAYLKTLK
jgi:cytochrome c